MYIHGVCVCAPAIKQNFFPPPQVPRVRGPHLHADRAFMLCLPRKGWWNQKTCHVLLHVIFSVWHGYPMLSLAIWDTSSRDPENQIQTAVGHWFRSHGYGVRACVREHVRVRLNHLERQYTVLLLSSTAGCHRVPGGLVASTKVPAAVALDGTPYISEGRSWALQWQSPGAVAAAGMSQNIVLRTVHGSQRAQLGCLSFLFLFLSPFRSPFLCGYFWICLNYQSDQDWMKHLVSLSKCVGFRSLKETSKTKRIGMRQGACNTYEWEERVSWSKQSKTTRAGTKNKNKKRPVFQIRNHNVSNEKKR